MRMNPLKGESASQLIARSTQDELARLLDENADEPHAHLIARMLKEQPLATTHAAERLLRSGLHRQCREPRKADVKMSVRRTFQALRIAVNDEFATLDALLRVLPQCLAPGGRVGDADIPLRRGSTREEGISRRAIEPVCIEAIARRSDPLREGRNIRQPACICGKIALGRARPHENGGQANRRYDVLSGETEWLGLGVLVGMQTSLNLPVADDDDGQYDAEEQGAHGNERR
jgi:hypothetical protein